MGEATSIQWCHHTFNPWRGCTKVSPGCTNCYAETMSKRNPGVLGVWGDAGTRVVAAESYWRQPLKWDRDAAKAGERRRVFCASLADVFEDRPGRVHDSQGNVLWHDRERGVISAGRTTPGLVRGERTAILDDVRDRLRWLMFDTPNLDWLLLTKRPEYAAKYITDHLWPDNVWLGVSVENQQAADERIPVLLSIPAKVRFLSMEPLLGPVDLGHHLIRPEVPCPDGLRGCEVLHLGPPLIHWVIVGGESGGKARPFDLSWARSIRDQCAADGVSFFMKQMGANPEAACNEAGLVGVGDGGSCLDNSCRRVSFRDSHGGDMSEWPEDLRVREVPTP